MSSRGMLTALAFSGATGYAWTQGYELAYRNLNLGNKGFLILFVLFVLALIYTVWDYVSATKRKSLIATLPDDTFDITFGKSDLTFAVVKKGTVQSHTVPYTSISKERVWYYNIALLKKLHIHQLLFHEHAMNSSKKLT